MAVPTTWNEFEINAIPKPNKVKNNIKNYRPIALISTLAKFFNKIIVKHLNKTIENNQILLENSFGFRPVKTTTDYISKLISEIESATNQQ